MKVKRLLTYLGLLIIVFSLFGCEKKRNVPEIIRDHYGNNQFKISFNSNELDKPLNDVYYSANSYPTIPTPSKLGYIFQGWYFDKDFKFPYEESLLLLKMCDISLYPKFIKEEFSREGIYEIDFITRFDDTKLEKGELVKDRNDFVKFNEHIDKKETYIEKAGDRLYLRIKFNMQSATPFGRPNPVNIKLIPIPGTDLKMDQEINALNETNKTIIIDITNFDLKQPIILGAINFLYDVICDNSELNKIAVKYAVMFKVTNIYGFEKSYINSHRKIDDGLYLIKTYKRTSYNENSMASVFNEIYSYLIVENNKYKLVKPFTPYTGIVNHYDDKDKTKIKDRNTAFISGAIAFDIKVPNEPERVDVGFIPDNYDAKKYLKTSIYFDYDEFKFYHIFELDSLNRDILLCSFVTGPMEQSIGLGQLNSIIKLDYNRMIKLDKNYFKLNIDLNKPYYTYQKEMLYSPSSVLELNKSGTLHNAIMNNYIGTYFPNFYFTDNKIYSSIVEFIPQDDIMPVNNKDKFARFLIKHKIFNYNEKEILNADVCHINIIEGTGLRDKKQILNGLSINPGEYVSLSEIYKKHINDNNSFTECTITCYPVNDLKVDYNNPLSINQEFNFTTNIAVKFNNKSETSIFYFYKKTDPQIEVLNYDPHKIYNVDEIVKIPDIKYSWHGVKNCNFIKEYYLNDLKSTNATRIAIVDETFKVSFLPIDKIDFLVADTTIKLLYQLENIFDEIYYHELVFKSEKRDVYELYEVNNGTETLLEKNIVQNETINNELIRKKIIYEHGRLLYNYNLDDLTNVYFKLKIGNKTLNYYLTKYRIIYPDKDFDGNKNSSGFITNYQVDEVNTPYKLHLIIDEIKTKLTGSYCYLGLEYKTQVNDTIRLGFLTNTSISGLVNPKNVLLADAKTLFTNQVYRIPMYHLVTDETKQISQMWFQVALNNLEHVNHNNYYKYDYDKKTLEVFKPCEIILSGSFTVASLFNSKGERVFFSIPDSYNDFKFPSIILSDIYEVRSNTGDIQITYITDSLHPFADGSTILTKKHNLRQGFATLSNQDFIASSDYLMGFVLNSTETAFNFHKLYFGIISKNFIKTFNTDDLVLYALWDKGVDVTIDYDKPISGKDNMKFKVFANNPQHKHIITSAKLKTFAIEGYIHTNWLNVNTGLIYDKNTPEIVLRTDTTFKIVYKKIHTIKFIIDETYSNDYLPNQTVLNGEKLKEDKCKITTKPNTTFLGWFANGIKFNFDNPITSDMELVAKFT